jgi:hypothetical protein
VDDDVLNLGMSDPFGPIRDVLAGLQNQLQELEIRQTVDPDGELSTTDRMLRMKRGRGRG